MRHEGALQRVQLLASGEPLNRADRASLRLHREHQAGADGVAVDEHGPARLQP
jgi:hypothetical protein